MPTGKQHLYFCGKRCWDIPCLYDRRCPLDNRKRFIAGENWKSFHWRIIREVLPTIDGTPTIDGCVIYTQTVLDEMNRHFDLFLSQLPGMLPERFRPCWKAHLIADCAYKYWYWGTGEQRYIRQLPDDHPFWVFVKDVGKRMLEQEQ